MSHPAYGDPFYTWTVMDNGVAAPTHAQNLYGQTYADRLINIYRDSFPGNWGLEGYAFDPVTGAVSVGTPTGSLITGNGSNVVAYWIEPGVFVFAYVIVNSPNYDIGAQVWSIDSDGELTQIDSGSTSISGTGLSLPRPTYHRVLGEVMWFGSGTSDKYITVPVTASDVGTFSSVTTISHLGTTNNTYQLLPLGDDTYISRCTSAVGGSDQTPFVFPSGTAISPNTGFNDNNSWVPASLEYPTGPTNMVMLSTGASLSVYTITDGGAVSNDGTQTPPTGSFVDEVDLDWGALFQRGWDEFGDEYGIMGAFEIANDYNQIGFTVVGDITGVKTYRHLIYHDVEGVADVFFLGFNSLGSPITRNAVYEDATYATLLSVTIEQWEYYSAGPDILIEPFEDGTAGAFLSSTNTSLHGLNTTPAPWTSTHLVFDGSQRRDGNLSATAKTEVGVTHSDLLKWPYNGDLVTDDQNTTDFWYFRFQRIDDDTFGSPIALYQMKLVDPGDPNTSETGEPLVDITYRSMVKIASWYYKPSVFTLTIKTSATATSISTFQLAAENWYKFIVTRTDVGAPAGQHKVTLEIRDADSNAIIFSKSAYTTLTNYFGHHTWRVTRSFESNIQTWIEGINYETPPPTPEPLPGLHPGKSWVSVDTSARVVVKLPPAEVLPGGLKPMRLATFNLPEFRMMSGFPRVVPGHDIQSVSLISADGEVLADRPLATEITTGADLRWIAGADYNGTSTWTPEVGAVNWTTSGDYNPTLVNDYEYRYQDERFYKDVVNLDSDDQQHFWADLAPIDGSEGYTVVMAMSLNSVYGNDLDRPVAGLWCPGTTTPAPTEDGTFTETPSGDWVAIYLAGNYLYVESDEIEAQKSLAISNMLAATAPIYLAFVIGKPETKLYAGTGQRRIIVGTAHTGEAAAPLSGDIVLGRTTGDILHTANMSIFDLGVYEAQLTDNEVRTEFAKLSAVYGEAT